jgi:hypothetical protein
MFIAINFCHVECASTDARHHALNHQIRSPCAFESLLNADC